MLNNVAMLWSAYHCVYGTSCFYILCQPVHSCIEPSLHGLELFLEIFLWRFVLFFFDKQLFCYVVPPTYPCMCALTNSVLYALLPQSSRKNRRSEVTVMLKTKLKRYIRNSYRVTAWLFEERRRWTIHRFRFAAFSYCTLLLLLQTGAGSISCSMYF